MYKTKLLRFNFFHFTVISFFLQLLFLSLLTKPLIAVPHFNPQMRVSSEEKAMCRINTQALEKNVERITKFAPGFAPPISSTTYNLAIIRVDFSDVPMTLTRAQTEAVFLNVRNFYLENSYNLLSLNITVSDGGTGANGAFRMPQTHATYANGLSSQFALLTSDAIAEAIAQGFNFTSFDHVMLYHAGFGAETSSNPGNHIWSVFLPSSLVSGPTAGSKTFSGITVVPEQEFFSIDPLGVICHEYGHQLGLPDLYNTGTNPTSSVVGNWSLMDSGVFIGSPLGSNPAHFDAWSKLFLGFSSPETISFTEGVSKTLTQAETSRTSFIRLPINSSSVGSGDEYFLLEYRRTSGATYDTSLPGQGLLIWHIDDSIASNATRLAANTVNIGSPNLGVNLVEADGSDSSTNNGDSTDPWPGTATTFGAPNSNAYNGQASEITVSNISSAGSASISMDIESTLSNPAIAQNTTQGNVVVTGGAQGYVNPDLGEKVLIGTLPSTSGTVEIKIYSLSGELVKETSVSGTQGINTTILWDAKNTSGEIVSSGIYIIHIKGGGIDVKKKTAIIR